MTDYTLLNKQLEALVDGEQNAVGILANAAALLKETTGWFWTGFYMVHGDQLWLGPFQGPVACCRIGYGKGVCGSAWAQGRSLVVPDVEDFPGHIACSSLSRSEIVVPIFSGGRVLGVLDIDSTETGTFTEEDRIGLEAFCAVLSRALEGKELY